MKIYTKSGDLGNTKLIGGCTVTKSDPRVESYGTIDELNSHIGFAISMLKPKTNSKKKHSLRLKNRLLKIQHQLFNLGSLLAVENSSQRQTLPPITELNTAELETEIDFMTKQLPALKSFILPGGTPVSASLHIARTVCRRAERMIVLHYQNDPANQVFYAYVNRLSDFLFTAARFSQWLDGKKDILWDKNLQ